MPKKIKKSPEKDLNIAVARKFRQALIDNGYKGLQLDLLMAQAADETDGFNHKNALDNNNFAGVKFNKSFKSLAAPSSSFAPPPSEDKKKTSYASFKDINDFVKKWPRITHLNDKLSKNDVGAPLKATDINDYAHRLKLNAYYGATEKVYAARMHYWDAQIKKQLLRDGGARPERDNETTVKDSLIYSVQTPKANAINNSDLYRINALLDLKRWIKEQVGASEVMHNIKSPIKDISVKKRNDSKPSGEHQIQNPVLFQQAINKEQIMKNIFMNHPEIKNKWSTPEFKDTTPDKNVGDIEDDRTETNNDHKNRQGLLYSNTADNKSTDQAVNINVNTPLIGSFTMSAKEVGTALSNLRQQIEGVLIEALNSVNGIA